MFVQDNFHGALNHALRKNVPSFLPLLQASFAPYARKAGYGDLLFFLLDM